MKKAKFFLSAVAVLGVVGGALAFKAHRTNTLATIYTDCVAGTLQDKTNFVVTYLTSNIDPTPVNGTTGNVSDACGDLSTTAAID